ncbi:MAG: DUF885 domain-containing protein [Flavobacteriaceae bacterium]
MKCLFTFLSALLLCTACQQKTEPVPQSPNRAIDSLFIAFFEFKKGINPMEATKAGYNEYNDTIANYISDDYQQFLIDSYEDFLERSSRFDSVRTTPEQWLSLKVLQWDCAIKKEGLTNAIVTMASPIYDLPSFELMPLFQIQSLHLYVAQMAGGTGVQPFKTVKDYDDWLNRLDDYEVFLDTCILKMKEGMAKQLVMPRALALKMLPQLNGFVSTPVGEHLFYTPIKQMPESFSDADRERLDREYRALIADKLVPAYKRLNDFIETDYLPNCRNTSGIGALPNGKTTYDYLIRLHTTTDLTADEIHELGKQEVARILGEMEKAKAEIGFEGDIRAFFDHVRKSEEQMPFTQPEEVLAHFNEIKERIDLRLGQVFDLKPKADFEVRRTEAFREASASAEYVPGSKDAVRSGIFYVPIPDVRTYNKFADEALFLHEAVPGHHYQLSLQQENDQLPEFLHPESMGVFVEGWALYAESLGKELGLYSDPYQYFGMLSMEMHRAIRLVVDTGIHAKGWTREQAIQYSLDHEAESEDGIIAEIERYMATPGQAVSYKIGQLKIRQLRDRAEMALGQAFDIKEFHNQILNSGSLPLVLLEKKIDAWIDLQR